MFLIQLLIYLPLQILFLPLAIVGGSYVGYRQLVISKRLGVSQTAIEVINGRWTMHIFGMRKDDATAALAPVLENDSTIGLWICLLPLWLTRKLTGRHFLYPRKPAPGAETILDLVPARTLYFDGIINRQLEDAHQFVLMGAGYDTRAYGNLAREGVAYFEVDQNAVQQHKRAALSRTEIKNDHVRYVTVDFSTDDPFEKLIAAGYDPTLKTVFLWEGVTLYLSADDVSRTLQAMRAHAAAGSAIVTDIYAERFLKFARGKAAEKTLEYTGEGMDFGLVFNADADAVIRAFAGAESLSVGDTCFLGRNHKEGPFAVVAELLI